MKLLAILGSPHRTIANTYQLTQRITSRVEAEGWETETVHLSDIEMYYCAGCGLCLMKGDCPQKDDVHELHSKMLRADAIVLGSPVYVLHVTAQMKTFLDRCVSLAHRPCLQGKYGAAVTVYAGVGSAKAVANYLNNVLAGWGATPVGAVSALAVRPGEVPQRALNEADELAEKIIDAVYGRKQYPAPEPSPQMKRLIKSYPSFFKADYAYWIKKGWIRE